MSYIKKIVTFVAQSEVMKTQLVQTQNQRLTPQQVQLVRLLELPVHELETRIREELENNFVLEEGETENIGNESEEFSNFQDDGTKELDDEYQVKENNISISELNEDNSPISLDYDDDEIVGERANAETTFSPLNIVRTETDFREELKSQLALRTITDEQRFLGNYIIDSLDDSGYLLRPLTALCDDLEFTLHFETNVQALQDALSIVQDLEPAGIGARDVKECLMLQLEGKKGSSVSMLAYSILKRSFEDFSKHRYERLMQVHSVTRDELDAAMSLILHLQPRPAGIVSDLETIQDRYNQVTPDFIVENEDGHLILHLNEKHIPTIRISSDINSLLESLKIKKTDRKLSVERSKVLQDSRDAAKMIREKKMSAELFIDSLRQRRETLIAVMSVILVLQQDYFLTGDREQLHPMVLNDVASRTGYDISTISRVSNSKYVQTDFGIFPVKQLFSATTIQTDRGEVVSSEIVKSLLKQCIEEEDKRKPLTDEQLTERMVSAGFPMARRTVAKYREQLGYNSARLRREV